LYFGDFEMDAYADPAHELAIFFQNLRKSYNGSSKCTGEVLLKYLNIGPRDARFYILSFDIW
jgi:hypothetical protein